MFKATFIPIIETVKLDYLIDCDRQEKRYKIESLLVSGDHFQVALVIDTENDDLRLCAKSIAYDPDLVDDLEYVKRRQASMAEELEFTNTKNEYIPDYYDLLNVESEETALETEPVLILEYLQGRTLEQIVEVEGPLEPERVREIAVELTKFLKQCHEKGWIFRNLHPSHIISAADGSIYVVGTGNATRRGEPPSLAEIIETKGYLAPEIREEVGGSTLQPPADLYSLGALLSFLLTGEHPRAVIENPLTEFAYQQLSNQIPEGMALIVAKLMAPMAKNRLPSTDELLPYLEKNNLPTPTTPGFGMVLLPAPWSGAEHPDSNRAVQSKLSPGPLISVKPNPVVEGARPPKATTATPHQKRVMLIVLVILALLIIVALVFLTVLKFWE